MAKGILLATILISCAAAGRLICNARKRKIRVLGDILAAMRVLRLRMLNSMEPVGILLRKSEFEIFRNIGNNLWDSGGLRESWIEQRRQNTKRGRLLDCISEEELGILDQFFENLGRSGKDEQNALFSASISMFEEAQNRAKSGFTESAKLYTALGALTGIAICILIV